MKEQFKHDFWDNFLSGMSTGTLTAGFVMAFIGIAISLLVQATTRDPNDSRSPVHFDWKFFFNDNTIRIIRSIALSILVIFVSLRFAKNLIGTEASMFYALCIGLGIDKATDWIIKARDKFFPPQNKN